MWPRICESVTGVWLAASPFLLGAPTLDAHLFPAIAGAAIVGIDWWSRSARLVHFLVVVVAVALIGWGWARFARPGPPVAQSAIVAGLLLALLGIIPNRAGDPPPRWRPHVRESG